MPATKITRHVSRAKTIHARVTPEMHEKLLQVAQAEKRSLTSLIEIACERYLENLKNSR